MVKYGITEIQNKPSLLKSMELAEIVDKRAGKSLGVFISKKYERYIADTIKKIEKEEKLKKLQRLKKHQDIEFLEVGVDDGL